MSEHVRLNIGDRGENQDSDAQSGIVLPRTPGGKIRVIVLLAVLAITLSGFAVYRVVTQTSEEVPEEAVARAISIEMQMGSGSADPPAAPDAAPPTAPAERPGRARAAPGKGG